MTSAKEADSGVADEKHKSEMDTANEPFLEDGRYSLYEHPTTGVGASSEDMHTYVDVPEDHKTESYGIVINTVHSRFAGREDKDSDSDEVTGKELCTGLDTQDDMGAAASQSCAEEYDAFYMSEPCNKQEFDEWILSDGAKAKDYQTFNDKVPDNLFHIKVPSIDITELDLETDLDGNRAIFVSGGFGDIFQARLSTTEEEVIAQIVKT